MAKLKWYRIRENETRKELFAAKGFGTDGTLVAIYDKRDVSRRETTTYCREHFVVVGQLDEAENKEIDTRFMDDLYR